MMLQKPDAFSHFSLSQSLPYLVKREWGLVNEWIGSHCSDTISWDLSAWRVQRIYLFQLLITSSPLSIHVWYGAGICFADSVRLGVTPEAELLQGSRSRHHVVDILMALDVLRKTLEISLFVSPLERDKVLYWSRYYQTRQRDTP